MKKFLKSQFNKNDALLKHTLIIFLGAGIANVLNYGYHLLVVRKLTPFDYGVFSSLFALLYVILMAASVLGIVTTKYSADYYARREYGKIRTLFTKISLKVIVFGVVGFIVFSLCRNFIADFMNMDSTMPVMLVGVLGFLTLFLPIYDGLLGGLQKFTLKSIAGTITPLFKIIFLAIFVYMGYKVNGAFLALIIAYIAGTIFYMVPNLFLLRHKSEAVDNGSIMKFIFPTFVGTVLPMMLINVDIILVKHYLPSVQAGYYGAASMLAKMIFFATSPVVTVMLPKASKLHSRGENTKPILKASMFYTILISLAGVLVYFFAPTFVVNLLYGQEYKIAPIIGLFALAIALFSLNNVLINYNLAKNRFGFSYFVIVIGIVEIAAITFAHNSLAEIIKILIVSFGLLCCCLLFYTSRDLGVRLPSLIGGMQRR